MVVEAVVTANSPMIGNTVEQLALRERHGLNLLALSRSGRRIAQRLRRVRFQDGDLLVLQGRAERINDKLAALGCLPLAERNVPLGRPRNLYLPAVILGVAMVLVTTGTVSVPVGFFGAAVTVLVFQLLTLQEAYDAVEWPVLILFGALIPVSEALQTTGATGLVAGWLSGAAQHLPALGGLGLTLLAAMALTPFLNNAATVLVMAPIAASLAGKLGAEPRPLPHGGRDRRRLRFPHADRAPVQHARHGARRVSLRRLLASWPAPVAHRRPPRHSPDQLVLAAAIGVGRDRVRAASYGATGRTIAAPEAEMAARFGRISQCGTSARSAQGLHGDRDPGRGGQPAQQAEDQGDPREQRRPQAGQHEGENRLGALRSGRPGNRAICGRAARSRRPAWPP